MDSLLSLTYLSRLSGMYCNLGIYQNIDLDAFLFMRHLSLCSKWPTITDVQKANKARTGPRSTDRTRRRTTQVIIRSFGPLDADKMGINQNISQYIGMVVPSLECMSQSCLPMLFTYLIIINCRQLINFVQSVVIFLSLFVCLFRSINYVLPS